MTRASRDAGHRRWRIRRISSRVLVVLLLSAGVMTVAAPAWAISLPFIGNCKSQPVPQAPGDGVTGFFEVKPSPMPAPAAAFGQNPASTEYVQYGYSGLFWSTYDLGCLSNPITDAGPIIDTMVGNWTLGAAKTIVALDNSAHEWAANPTWTATLTPLVGGANNALYKALFLVWAGAALMTVGISVALRAHRSDMPGALTLAMWALFVITLVSGVVAAPGWVGEQASGLMSTTLNALDAGFAGPGAQANESQAHASLTVSAILYPAWLRGEFGDPSSPAAQQYGAALFQAQALTWSQANASPAQINATNKADQAKWAQVASAVQKNYPEAYPDLQGTGSSRIGAGILAVLTAVIVCGYDFIASLVVIMALLAVMAGAVMLPALAVVGLHHNMRHVVIGLGSRVFGMLINGVLWAAGAAVDALVTRTLLSNAIVPPTLALLILAVMPFILWMITRVLRGRPAVPRAVRRAAMLGLGLAFLRGGAAAGARAGAQEAAADAATAGSSSPSSTRPRGLGGWTRRHRSRPTVSPRTQVLAVARCRRRTTRRITVRCRPRMAVAAARCRRRGMAGRGRCRPRMAVAAARCRRRGMAGRGRCRPRMAVAAARCRRRGMAGRCRCRPRTTRRTTARCRRRTARRSAAVAAVRCRSRGTAGRGPCRPQAAVRRATAAAAGSCRRGRPTAGPALPAGQPTP